MRVLIAGFIISALGADGEWVLSRSDLSTLLLFKTLGLHALLGSYDPVPEPVFNLWQ